MANGNTGLLDNRAFLATLLGAGQSMQAGQPISAGINPVLMQTLGAQSQYELNKRYMQMFASMLRGDVPEGGKLTMDSKGMSLNMPKTSLQGTQEGGPWEGLAAPWNPSATTQPMQSQATTFNPFRLTSQI